MPGENINIAIVGLGRVGSIFLGKLLEHQSNSLSIVAAIELNTDAPGLAIAHKYGVPVYKDSQKLMDMMDELDIIFDLTGDQGSKRELRMSMIKSSNKQTFIAPEIVAFFIWDLIAAGKELPQLHAITGY